MNNKKLSNKGLVTESRGIKEVRGIKEGVKILLYAKTAGRCEICNELVIKDIITGMDVNWGEKAHIYAFSKGGPRADKKEIQKNDVNNLLLVCPNCHEKIDKKGQERYYTVEFLKNTKSKHETRIKLSTSFDEKRQTKVLKMIANVNNEKVDISTPEVVVALMNERLIPCEDRFEVIDFSDNNGIDNSTYWKSKSQEIIQTVSKFHSDLNRQKIGHVSVFGMGPMPLLMFLGSKLDNKIKTKVFQCHRDGEDWMWKKGVPTAVYKFKRVKKGSNKNKAALLLSLSGSIDKGLMPDNIRKDNYIYELSIEKPNYNFLRTEADLCNFEKEFTNAISNIKNSHPKLKQIDVFPAVPAPVAILCGRSLNKNSDPKLRIFNTYNKNKFKYSLTIN